MNQRQFDEDLKVRWDDTFGHSWCPEEEEGFEENPIKILFEQGEGSDVKDGDEQ